MVKIAILVYGNYWWAIPMSMLSGEEIKALDKYHTETPRETDKVWITLEERLWGNEMNKHRRCLDSDCGTMLEPGVSVGAKFSWLRKPPEVD